MAGKKKLEKPIFLMGWFGGYSPRTIFGHIHDVSQLLLLEYVVVQNSYF